MTEFFFPTDDPAQVIANVVSTVRRLVPPSLDPENLAMDICLASWTNGYDRPAYSFIRQRCLNALRDTTLETTHMSRIGPHEPHDPSVDDLIEVDRLLSILTPPERKVIYLRYFREYTIPEIADRTSTPVNTVRETIVVALYKMRSAA